MLPPAGIPACPWQRTVAGPQSDGGTCHPATVPEAQGPSPCPWQPALLAMEQSMAPSERGQGWRCPRRHSGSAAWLRLVPAPFPFAPSSRRLGPPRLRSGSPTASLSAPAGTGVIPCSSPPPALRVSPRPSHGFGEAKCSGGAAGMGCRQRCPASRPRLARPRWPVRLAAGECWERQAGPGGPGLHPGAPSCLETRCPAGWGTQTAPGAVC